MAIKGVHVLLYTPEAEQLRATLDVWLKDARVEQRP